MVQYEMIELDPQIQQQLLKDWDPISISFDGETREVQVIDYNAASNTWIALCGDLIVSITRVSRTNMMFRSYCFLGPDERQDTRPRFARHAIHPRISLWSRLRASSNGKTMSMFLASVLAGCIIVIGLLEIFGPSLATWLSQLFGHFNSFAGLR